MENENQGLRRIHGVLSPFQGCLIDMLSLNLSDHLLYRRRCYRPFILIIITNA